MTFLLAFFMLWASIDFIIIIIILFIYIFSRYGPALGMSICLLILIRSLNIC